MPGQPTTSRRPWLCDQRWSFWPRFFWGCMIGCIIAIGVGMCAGYAQSFFSRGFWQQLVTTSAGAALAFVAALYLYRWQERRSRISRRQQDEKEAGDLLVAIRREILDNSGFLQDYVVKDSSPEHLRVHRLATSRLNTLMMTWGCTRLLQLLRDYDVVQVLSRLKAISDRVNRTLELYSGTHLAFLGMAQHSRTHIHYEALARVREHIPVLYDELLRAENDAERLMRVHLRRLRPSSDASRT